MPCPQLFADFRRHRNLIAIFVTVTKTVDSLPRSGVTRGRTEHRLAAVGEDPENIKPYYMENNDSNFVRAAFSFVLGYAERDLEGRKPGEPYAPKFNYSPGDTPAEQPGMAKQTDLIRLETAIEELHRLWDKWNRNSQDYD